MRARTEDLLKIRDGEPMDAERRRRLLAHPENALELERLTRIGEDLRALPDLAPPPDAWRRIAAEVRAHPRRGGNVPFLGLAAAALAASLAAAALLLGLPSGESPVPAEDRVEATPSAARVDYRPLVEESGRLETLLLELEWQPSLMSAGTATTIANLEDHIVLLDEQLTYAEARNADPSYRQALWRERVDVMNALLQVRYAQSPRPTN